MRWRVMPAAAAGLVFASLAAGQNQPVGTPPGPAAQAAGELAERLARQVSGDLHVKTVVGEPIKVGSVTAARPAHAPKFHGSHCAGR